MIAIGIDPGFDGGLAIVNDGLIAVYDLPTLTVEGAIKDHREYDLRALVALLRPYVDRDVMVAIEYVRGIPRRPGLAGQQGASSIWRQGYGVGVIEGCVAGLGFAWERVAPQRWRKALAIPGGADAKEASRLIAIQRFPAVADQLARKKDHGRAEALLLASYLRQWAKGLV